MAIWTWKGTSRTRSVRTTRGAWRDRDRRCDWDSELDRNSSDTDTDSDTVPAIRNCHRDNDHKRLDGILILVIVMVESGSWLDNYNNNNNYYRSFGGMDYR
eukprot:jgi/Psemu1/10324/gm1.10324_g